MYQQRKAVHVVPPVVASQNETQAKEKLAGYVYEYLLHAGASKSAEMFKSEMLPQHNVAQINLGDSPGFLQDWWCVFWDLYSAAPERREKFEPSQEAKAFHEYGFIQTSAYPPGPPMMNGMHAGHPQFGNGGPGGMGMPPGGMSDVIPGYFGQRGGQPGPSAQSNQASPLPGGGHRYAHPGTRSGAPTPLSGMPPNFPAGAQPPPHMFAEQIQIQRMQAVAAAQQRLPPGGGRPGVPSNYAPIRHPIRPYGPGGAPFLDSPSGTPPFQQNPMIMQNGGGMSCSTNPLMSSPGPGPPGSVPQMGGPSNPDGAHDPRFMIQMPGASNFGMSHHEGGGGTPTSNPSQGNGLSMQQVPPDNTPSSAATGGQLQSLLNGGGDGGLEMKQSPANGGPPSHNPGSIQGGPASVAGHGPGSVHSQSGGAPNSVSMAAPNSHQTPTSEPANMDFQGMSRMGDEVEASEISKIKADLINDFQSYP